MSPAFDLDDGAVHTVKIAYQPGTLQVSVDDLTTPLLTVGVDLTAYNLIGSSRAFVGFTSGVNGPTSFPDNRDGVTDGSANHDILNWSFVCAPAAVPEPSGVALIGVGISCGLFALRRRRASY